ncbi:unnamed protein product (macronuclear) [Paramecium tetraurelia]|uniref:Uncharacterized protein n=1 Tax=Paramecium tetraurelia TaxID=5888 RepID=A0BK82_PARTE|nr:uncharacterized protein GSPATT00029579001 [Paramecium tetraurelia]CAK58949.1 unnamed protein product [Paramecium tetraurelia]|eukprot:XP_001426347.1 hypothetical protein (macronuclear) [Paramecium tetraurelia strain d4-2]
MRSIKEIRDDIEKAIRQIEKKIRLNKKIAIKNYVKKYKRLLDEFREIERVSDSNFKWND